MNPGLSLFLGCLFTIGCAVLAHRAIAWLEFDAELRDVGRVWIEVERWQSETTTKCEAVAREKALQADDRGYNVTTICTRERKGTDK